MSKVILFQGDSITDAGRIHDSTASMGGGYAMLVKAELGFENPGEYQFFNRGNSGNRVLDMYSRIVKDLINLKPDYLSVLIGVNDVWHGIDYNNGTGIDRFEKVYNMFIEEVKTELPDIKIIMLEPFVLKGAATDNRDDQPDRWQKFSSGVYEMAKVARRIAEKHSIKFLELQSKFDAACELQSPNYWLHDGVHPTPMGHELIKREWIKTFNEIK